MASLSEETPESVIPFGPGSQIVGPFCWEATG
jgi:hypothetical protein